MADDTLPKDVYPDSRFRLPLPKLEDLEALPDKEVRDKAVAQFKMFHDPNSGSLVGLSGPGGIRLHSPGLAVAARPTLNYLRKDSPLSGRQHELAILVTARAFDCEFEWAAHVGEARKKGVPEAVIEIVRLKKPADGIAEEDKVIIDLGRELWTDHRVSPETFARALKQLGTVKLVDLVGLMGSYSATAAMLTAFDIQLPPGKTKQLG